MIRFACSSCGKVYKESLEFVGKKTSARNAMRCCGTLSRGDTRTQIDHRYFCSKAFQGFTAQYDSASTTAYKTYLEGCFRCIYGKTTMR